VIRYSPWILAAATIIAAIATLAFHHQPATAQGAITVVSEDAVNEFPTGVTFTVAFQSSTPVGEARLRYELAPDGTGASAVAECSGTTTLTCSHTLVSGAGIYVIPGASITWHWDIEDELGNSISTGDKLYVHEDTRFTFQSLSRDNVTVFFHDGTAAEAPSVLDAAAETISSLGALLQTDVPFPVKVYLYETAQEMQPAIATGGVGRGVTILGEVVYSDTAMVSADVNTLDITRHEIAHIVTREATKGPFGIPDWMNEGISVYSQRQGLAGHDAALNSAIDRDAVLTMPELNSSASGGTSGTVGLYYGQSGSIVRYLIVTYGEQQFADLVRTFREGSTINNAFESIYGFDQLGLENEWRASVGLPPRAASASPTPRATEEARAPVTPSTGGNQDSASTTEDNDTEVVTIAIVIALAALALAALIALGMVVVQRRG
jgi:hypothetical protein